MILDPSNTTVGDIVNAALRESGAIGVGQTPTGDDLSDAQARLQWMLQQWERKRWLIYHLVSFSIVSTGAQSYSVGPGGALNTQPSAFNNQFNSAFGSNQARSVRPARIESAFLRQIVQSQPNQIDYPLERLESMEDYNLIRLKQLQSFPSWFFYDPSWPLGTIYPWPVPQPAIYELHISILEQLPIGFATQAIPINLPYEYYAAMYLNLAIRLKSKYGMRLDPGDPLVSLAKDSLNVLRGANTAIARLQMPRDILRRGLYNVFSDTMY
jgi:hypothetical protein